MNEELNGQLTLRDIDPLAGKSFSVRKRDGRLAPFDESRIVIAVEAAFRASMEQPQDLVVAPS